MNCFRRHRRGPLACDRGVALVEFALILPFLLLIVLGMVDMGKAVSYLNDETHLANEAARYAAVNNSPDKTAGVPNKDSLNDWIKQNASSDELRNGGGSIQGTGLTVTILFPDLDNTPGNPNPGHCVGDPVKVTIRADYKWLDYLTLKGAVPAPVTAITGSSTMRLEKNYKEFPVGTPNPNAYRVSQPVTLPCP
jgi:hypothetical protein